MCSHQIEINLQNGNLCVVFKSSLNYSFTVHYHHRLDSVCTLFDLCADTDYTIFDLFHFALRGAVIVYTLRNTEDMKTKANTIL